MFGTVVAVFGLILTGAPAAPLVQLSTVRRDSAAVQIVENRGDLWSSPPRWSIEGRPLVHVGRTSQTPAYTFDQIRGIACLRDGRVVVASGGHRALRWFDSGGRFLFERGGRGAGPGEFESLESLSTIAGTAVVATDGSARRATHFGDDGTLASVARTLFAPAAPGVFRLASGAWLVAPHWRSAAGNYRGPQSDRFRLSTPIVLLSPDGARRDTIGVFQGTEVTVRSVGGDIAFQNALLGRDLFYAAGGSSDRIFLGTSDRIAIDVRDMRGSPIQSLRAPDVKPLAVTQQVAADIRRRLSELVGNVPPDQRSTAQRNVEAIVLPATAPAFDAMLVDSSGNLWLGEYRLDRQPSRRFLVFDPFGAFITVVNVPDGFRLHCVSGDRIWGVEADSLDVQTVVAYQVRR